MLTIDDEQLRGVFFVNERKPKMSLSLFFEKTGSGEKGLFIARRQPDDSKAREKLSEMETHWLLLRDEEDSIRPSDLKKLDEVITSFFEKHGGGIALLEGVELLMLFNEFSEVDALLNRLESIADSMGGAVILPVDSRAIYKEDYQKISSTYHVLESEGAERF